MFLLNEKNNNKLKVCKPETVKFWCKSCSIKNYDTRYDNKKKCLFRWQITIVMQLIKGGIIYLVFA